MAYYKNIIFSITALALLFMLPAQGISQDKIPVREYTNPDEVVTFDRTTPFSRALDIINEFSQEARGKVIIDRTGQEGGIGITVPPMHWEDALDLILRVKGLVLFEREEFYEILSPQTTGAQTQQASGQQGAAGDGEGPLATTRSREVRINAIFFEGNKRALQEIGVDWSTLTDNVPENIGDFANQGQGGGGGGDNQLPSSTFENQFVSVNTKGASSVSQNVFNSIVNFGEIGNSGIRVQALFSAFEADNLGEILASPTVKVLDGQDGRIQVGQDFSIKQRDFAGNVTDQFFSVGTILEVTPQIIEDNDTTFIHLDIVAERSSAQPDPVSTIINKQEAETKAVLIDGEATVIAGLYRSESAEVRRGIPILKDLPPWLFGLRYLFGYNSKDYQMRELVILIQASIEPSIPERYAQSEFKDKYEILEEERGRIRDELRKSEMNTGKLVEKEEEPDTLNQSTEETSATEGQDDIEEQADTAPQEPEQKSEEQAATPAEVEEEQQANARISSDPEVKTEPVSLNFGTEEEEKTKTAEETKAVTDEPAVENQSAETETMQADSAAKSTGAPTGSSDSDAGETETTTVNGNTQNTSGYTYYLIAGSFKNEQNAVDFKDELAEKEFPAVIFNKPDSDFFFVAYSQYRNFEQAKSALADIREYENESAWIYRN